MPYKLCPACRQLSYSTYNARQWYCPYCGRDITFVPFLPDKQRQNGVSRALRECYYLRTVSSRVREK